MIFSIINCLSFHGSEILHSPCWFIKNFRNKYKHFVFTKKLPRTLTKTDFCKDWVLSCKCCPSVTDNMYKNSGEIRQNSSVWNTRVTTTQLPVRWCEMIYRHFQISSEISVICVHSKRAISRSRYIGWETNISCLYILSY